MGRKRKNVPEREKGSDVRLTMLFPGELFDRLEAASKRRRITVGDLLVSLLHAHLEDDISGSRPPAGAESED